MFNAILVDDEPLAREELKLLLESDQRFTVVAEYSNALDCLTHYRELNADVLFVDIHMPQLNGLDLLKIITSEQRPLVVLVTAYEDYALQAFENEAFDYLLKPLDEKRLEKTLSRLERTLQPTIRQPQLTLLPCFQGQQTQLVRCETIEYAYTDLSGVHIFNGEQQLHTQLTLKALEQQLTLIRCHRQFLVNPGAITAITLQDNGSASLTTQSGATLPVSRRYLRALKELFAVPG